MREVRLIRIRRKEEGVMLVDFMVGLVEGCK